MTFGFGRDTDEVNGFDSDAHSDWTTDSTLSGDVRIQLPVSPQRQTGLGEMKIQHPVFRPEKIWCDYCKKNGHSLDFCPTRLETNQRVAAKWCTQGWHSPKIHDDRRVWRCKYCAMHLHEEYVWAVYPNECMAEEEKFWTHRLQVDKYLA